ncbi:MAG TPA: 1-acyl-sn-glycerol-3-phosphate acyltransferase [Bacteroidales bacterium]|nr:1-acyl-sn-glycerol-3-phosphate acyltransferase [Bacteroidales bacterium]
MGKENIEKYNAFYSMLKYVASFWHNKVFYRKVIIVGRENINPDEHLIFAPNHQNALMDALAVLFTTKGQLVFLARADIFRRKLLASVLYFIKILPVYRIRDGYDNLKENDWVFNKTIDVLKNKNGLVILPEGNHEGMRRLRQLKKGICRIAFQADEATGFSMNIKIVPVGLEFTHYSRVRQVLTVVYGKPIEVSDFYESYRKSPQRSMNELREKLSSEMQQLMVHIESVDDYEAIDELRSIINGKYSDDKNMPKLFRDRMLINSLNRLSTTSEETYRKICDLALKVKSGAAKLKTEYRLLGKKKHTLAGMIGGLLTLLLTFPVFIYGFIFNYLFVSVPNLSLKNIRDVQFHSSIRYTISLFLAFVLMPMYLILSFVIFSPWWLALAIFISIPFAGLYAWNYHLLYNRITGGFRIRKYIRKGNKEYEELRSSYDELVSLVSKHASL